MNFRMTCAGKLIRNRAWSLLLTAIIGGTGNLAAQHRTAAPQPPSQAQGAPSSDSASQDSASQDSSKPPGFARQLSQETREAAGEEKEKDDKAVFKQSASVRAISKLLGIGAETASLIAFLFNFAVIAGIFIWAGRKFLPGAFRARTEAIQKAMQEAQKASAEARSKLAEIEARLTKLDAEITVMRENAEQEAEAEEARIQAAAQEDARKLLAAAHQEIDAATKSARHALAAYAADLAVGLAQRQIHVGAEADRALIRNFAGQLGGSASELGSEPGKARN